MSFGGSTLVFTQTQNTGAPNDLGEFQQIATTTPAPGCRHRPLTFSEKVEYNLDVATEFWRSTVPLFEYDGTVQTALMSFPPNGTITVDGISYQIVGGVRPHPDRFGSPYKATIISQRQHG